LVKFAANLIAPFLFVFVRQIFVAWIGYHVRDTNTFKILERGRTGCRA
jgi:hypothetical protein